MAVARLLIDNSFKVFNVEYQGFLTNHISHGIIALHRLGASPERIERFVKWYRPRLEPASEYIEKDPPADSGIDCSKLLGAQSHFYTMYDYYERQLAANNGSLEQLIANNLPLLGRGLAGSALHGIIHLGYGYSANSASTVCEGLAYMHTSYTIPALSKVHSKPAEPSCGLLDILEELRIDTNLSNFVKTELAKPEWRQQNIGDFQRTIKILFTYRGDQLMSCARRATVPSELSASTVGRARWAVNNAIAVYAASELRNDFFLLHGVTGAWSMLQVVTLMGDEDKEQDLIIHYVCVLLATYIAQGSPKLDLELLTGPVPGVKIRQSWSEIIDDAFSKDYDEHIFKLVQVCHDMDRENTDRGQTQIYLTAASIALDSPLTYLGQPF